MDPNWITAGATVLIFAATALGAWAALATLSFYRGEFTPRVERADVFRGPGGIAVVIDLRNRSPGAIELIEARVMRPRGALLSVPLPPRPPDSAELWSEAVSATVPLKRSIDPSGTPRHRLFLNSGDLDRLRLRVQPPSGWSGGSMTIAISLETKSATARRSRIMIHRLIPALIAKQTDANARSQA